MEENLILVIDSDTISRNFFVSLLKKRGYQVTQAASGKDGLISAWRDLPDLILFDPNLPDLDGNEFALKLKQDPRTKHKKIIAVSSIKKPEEMIKGIEAGIDEYLFKGEGIPQQILELVPKLLGAEEDVEVKDERAKDGFLLPFVSAKGGAGATSLCINAATCLSDVIPGVSVAVVDFVLPIGSIASITGSASEINIATVASMPIEELTIDFFQNELPEPELWNFRLLPGSPDPSTSRSIIINRLPYIIEKMRNAFDYVLIDLGKNLSSHSLSILKKSDQITLVLSTEQSSVILTKTIWDYLAAEGIKPHNINPILNQTVSHEGVSKAIIEKKLGVKIIGAIPYMSGNFSHANNLHLPISYKFPDDTCTFALRQAIAELVEIARVTRPIDRGEPDENAKQF